jgi:hypothetical protein
MRFINTLFMHSKVASYNISKAIEVKHARQDCGSCDKNPKTLSARARAPHNTKTSMHIPSQRMPAFFRPQMKPLQIEQNDGVLNDASLKS